MSLTKVRVLEVAPEEFMKFPLVISNPHRDPSTHVFMDGTDGRPDKVGALEESLVVNTNWENILGRWANADKSVVEQAYGHHRVKAMQNLAAKYNSAKAAWDLMSKEDQEAKPELKPDERMNLNTIMVNVRPKTALPDPMMLRIFADENRDDWKEDPQNMSITLFQVKTYLDDRLILAPDMETFAQMVESGAAGDLKLSKSSFTKMKTAGGVSATLLHNYLGPKWARSTIDRALKVREAVDQNPHFQAAVNNMPNVTVSHRAIGLLEAAGIQESEEADEVCKAIIKHELSRSDIEALTNAVKEEATDPTIEKKTPVMKMIAGLKKAKAEQAKAAREEAAGIRQQAAVESAEKREAALVKATTEAVTIGDMDKFSFVHIKNLRTQMKAMDAADKITPSIVNKVFEVFANDLAPLMKSLKTKADAAQAKIDAMAKAGTGAE